MLESNRECQRTMKNDREQQNKSENNRVLENNINVREQQNMSENNKESHRTIKNVTKRVSENNREC